MSKSWDIIATVVFFPTENGGRRYATPDDHFNCMAQIDNEVFDVRLILDEHGPIYPGGGGRVPVRFLYPERAKAFFPAGARFLLRELEPIGEGVVEKSNV
jgi:hypothetical protein